MCPLISLLVSIVFCSSAFRRISNDEYVKIKNHQPIPLWLLVSFVDPLREVPLAFFIFPTWLDTNPKRWTYLPDKSQGNVP